MDVGHNRDLGTSSQALKFLKNPLSLWQEPWLQYAQGTKNANAMFQPAPVAVYNRACTLEPNGNAVRPLPANETANVEQVLRMIV